MGKAAQNIAFCKNHRVYSHIKGSEKSCDKEICLIFPKLYIAMKCYFKVLLFNSTHRTHFPLSH